MAEPRRVAFISLSPVRRREPEYPGAEREPEYPREPPRLEPQPYREPARAEQPAPREAAPRSDAQPPPREKPLPPREVSRAEPPMSLQREPPRPEPPPPPPLPQLHLQPPPPRESASRAEPQQRPPRETVRLELVLKDPTDESCVEFSYPELLLCGEQRKKPIHTEDPFNDEHQERQEVEMLAKKFEMKYGGKPRKHRKDRLQDLIDIGFGYDETDPFIDNSEAYDELVPASLTTKYGGFYINTGTLQFRQASDTEEEDITDSQKHKPPKIPKIKEDDIEMKKRKRKEEGEKEKKPRKKVPKQLGVMALNSHKSEKKKKRYKDSLSLAAMIRKFQKEKDALKKESNPKVPVNLTSSLNKAPSSAVALGNDVSDLNLNNADPDLPIFVSTNEHELFQEAENALEMLDDFDFDRLLDAASDGSPLSESGGENGNTTQPTYTSQVMPKVVPTLPEGLPVLLEKRIEDLRVAAKIFDEEGRKKFFTQDMNNILLDIELQLQELGPVVRSGVYSHLEAFVPCNKETLVKRLKKLHLNVQDDRLREPLQKLKLAVSNVMPEQLFKYQEDCQARSQAKCAKLQTDEEREKNGSEEDDDEKPGKRVIGPRKKFHWDDTIRTLLCNLVEIKLGCYELEPNKSQSAEDYLKSFMETEVKPLWPKGWMQARMLFKESRSVHNHLTSAPAKKKVIPAPKPKAKECSPKKDQKTPASLVASVGGPSTSSSTSAVASTSSSSTPAQETICLDDSLDEDLSFHPPALDLVSEALAVINSGNKGPPAGSRISMPTAKPRPGLREEKLASIMSKLPLATPKKLDSTQTAHSSSLIAGHTGPVPKKPQDLAHTGISSGLIAGSSIQNPKVSLEPLPARLLQQGLQRSSQIHASSSSQTHVSSSSQAQVAASSHALGTSEAQDASSLTQVTKVHQHSAVQQNYVSPLQATISKSQTNPVVKLSNNPQLSCSSPLIKTSDKPLMYRLPLSTPSSGNGSQGSHPLVSRTVPSTTTSSNYLAKAMVSQISTQGFKSPFSMAASPKLAASPKPATSPKPLPSPKPSASPKPSLSAKPSVSTKLISKSNPTPKPTVSPSSSSPSALVAQSSHSSSNNPVHKQPSGINISRQSPTLNLLPPNRTSGLPSTKNLQAPSKLTNSSSTGTVGKNSLSGIAMNVPASRGSNLNSSGANRTSLSGGTGSGTQGATKPLSTPHRPSSASGSSVVTASVQSTAGASLLANASPLTLMTSPLSVTNQNVTPFGMLGGLVPVTMPFQFPLELLGFGTDTAGVTTTSGSTSAAFHHSLAQNLLKGLQPGAQHAATLSHSPLPAHLQQTFNDGGQSKGDTKLPRKSQ
ncbi:PREDICTED: ubinuclein-2 isoform X1 [Ceratotherium simum simum]|uniref:Ubinuclein-2 isoform X1 n=1 Tax=Ceratotherium simum simum TaxID=73337 RepID=A0ABM1CUG3_CERSS|nr:PREDICTED: ubinuclein-2 isoform X1 [Ceratotherium simum simum]